MKELIEKLEDAKATLIADNYKTWSYVIMAIDEAIQALTSVKSESAEEVEKLKFMIDNGLGWDDMKNDIKYPNEL